jgi:hypothetical protein
MTPAVEPKPSYRYPGDEISWAGECPWTGGICFGTDEGNLMVPDFLPDRKEARSLLVNRDTINGLAFGDGFVVASSPTEVTSLPLGGELQVLYAGGAHHVLALSERLFLAPLGPYGLLKLLRKEAAWDVQIASVKSDVIYLYQMSSLPPHNGRQLVVCAGRSTGLVLFECDDRGGETVLSNRRYPQYDIVDVCSVPATGDPYAIAALTHDCALLLTRDVRQESVRTITIPGIDGTGYSLKRIQDHLLLLTSRALYVLENFSELFAGKPKINMRIFRHPGPASDVYVAYDQYVLLEVDDRVECKSIDDLLACSKGSSLHDTALIPTVLASTESPLQHLELVTG